MNTSNHDWRHDTLQLVLAFAQRRLLIAFILAGSFAVGLGAAYSATPYYSASATFVLLPREKPVLDLTVQSASVETSEDAARRSASATLTLPPNPDLYTSLIRSSDVAQQVAARLGERQPRGGLGRLDPSAIRAGLTVFSTEEGVVRIAMKHEDPQVAADVVNAIIQECERASKEIERQLISQQAGFLSTAIRDAESRLAEATELRSRLIERIGVGDPSATAARSAALLQTLDDTEARISRELERLLLHRTPLDPTVAALGAELEQVRAIAAETRAAYCGDMSEEEFASLDCEWRALEQDLTLRRDLLMSMRARHEVFRIRADQPAGNIAVIREASAPSAPAGPSKRVFLVLAVLGGGMIACTICVLLDQLNRAAQTPRLEEPIRAIRRCFITTRAHTIRPRPETSGGNT